MFDAAHREAVYQELKTTCYNADEVIVREDKTRELFLRHPELVIPYPPSHAALFTTAFGGVMPSGTGVLDLGTGNAGVLCVWEHVNNFLPPRIASDIHISDMNVTPGFDGIELSADKVLERFGQNAFDHVQCCETLEHVDEDVSAAIAKQMTQVTRKTAFITSCGLSHHMGPLNMEKCANNVYLNYKGQPNIETLMDLGYQVRLMGNYQILAWYIKNV